MVVSARLGRDEDDAVTGHQTIFTRSSFCYDPSMDSNLAACCEPHRLPLTKLKDASVLRECPNLPLTDLINFALHCPDQTCGVFYIPRWGYLRIVESHDGKPEPQMVQSRHDCNYHPEVSMFVMEGDGDFVLACPIQDCNETTEYMTDEKRAALANPFRVSRVLNYPGKFIVSKFGDEAPLLMGTGIRHFSEPEVRGFLSARLSEPQIATPLRMAAKAPEFNTGVWAP